MNFTYPCYQIIHRHQLWLGLSCAVLSAAPQAAPGTPAAAGRRTSCVLVANVATSARSWVQCANDLIRLVDVTSYVVILLVGVYIHNIIIYLIIMYIIYTYNYNIDCKPSIFRILLRSQKSHQFTYYFTQHTEYAACASRTSRMCLNSHGFQEDAKHLGGACFHPWCAAKLSQAAEWHFWRFCTGCCRCSCGGRGGGGTMITAGTTAPGLDSKTLGKSWQVDEVTVSCCEGYFRFYNTIRQITSTGLSVLVGSKKWCLSCFHWHFMACLLLLYVFPFVGLISTVQAEFNTKRNNDSAPVVSETCATYHNDVEAFYIFLPFRPFRGFERNLEPLSRFDVPENKKETWPHWPHQIHQGPHRPHQPSITGFLRLPSWTRAGDRVHIKYGYPILMKHGWPKKTLYHRISMGKSFMGCSVAMFD